jgi:hypothetical protein
MIYRVQECGYCGSFVVESVSEPELDDRAAYARKGHIWRRTGTIDTAPGQGAGDRVHVGCPSVSFRLIRSDRRTVGPE